MYVAKSNFAVVISYYHKMNKLLALLVLILLNTPIYAQVCETVVDGKKIEKAKMDLVDYIPAIHGTVCAKYEYQTTTRENRFQVRNARFSITGNVLPIVAYKLEVDLSDRGSVRMLDAYTRIFPFKDFNFTIGQMRVPFTIDAHRSPHLRYFVNRSFIAKQVGDVRDVGATIAYTRKDYAIPFILEAGLFNGNGLTEQKEWNKTLNYSVKAQFLFAKGWNLTLSNQFIHPEDIRIQMYDVGLYYENERVHIEGEYLYKTYNKNAFHPVHSIDIFGCYYIPLKRIFKQRSISARYDMMTDHSNGKGLDEDTKRLPISNYARHRATGGVTFSFSKKFVADIRLNYEKYFYRKNSIPDPSELDKISIEFMTRF